MNTLKHRIRSRILPGLLAAMLLVSLCACADRSSASPDLDIDLTKMSATMVYSEVFDMLYKPEDYMGKKIKMRGSLNAMYDDRNDDIIFACIIQDATACCAQGMIFRLAEEPEVFPEGGTEITVTGTYDYYTQEGDEYCYLKDAVLLTD